MKLGNIIRLFMPLYLLISIGASAQSAKKEKEQARYAQLKTAVDSREYVFNAQSATSMGGRTRQLTGSYTTKVHGDSLDVYLPYFGRAYSATPGDTNGGINFSTSSFTYECHDAKSGGWLILITPADQKNANKIQISITSSGYATVQVTSNNRQLISFYGNISTDSKSR